MGKKKGLAAIFSRPKLAAAESPPWPWPSCATTPQTASFRGQAGGRHGDYDTQCSTTTTAGRCVVDAGPDGTGGRLLLLPPRSSSSKTAAPGDMYRTVNSVYLDDPADETCFSYFDDNEDESDGGEDDGGVDVVSFSTATASEEWSEAVIRSLGRSSTDRFFVEPPASNSILLAASRSPSPSPVWTPTPVAALQQRPKAPAASAAIMPSSEAESDIDSVEEEEEQEHEQQHHEEEARAPAAATTTSPLVEESVAVALDSEDPYRDFRASMEEMVAAHGLRDWPALQEMLLWYLRINAKHTHALIVGAFVDLLIGLAASSSTGSRSAGATTSATTISTSTSKAATTTSSSGSSSSSNSSVAGDGATTCSTAVTSTTMLDDEQCQCGGRGNSSGTDASCSPAAPSSDQEDEEDRPLGKKRASADELAFHVKLCP